MQTKIINLYTFSELPENIKEKLIKDEYEGTIDMLNDVVSDDFREQVNEFFGSDLKVYYSLNYSQGDGVAFEGKVDLELFLKNYKEKFNRSELRLLNKCKDSITIKVSHHGRYYHEKSFDVALEINQYSYSRDYKYVDDLKTDIEDTILGILQDFSLKLKGEGYRQFDSGDEYSREKLEEEDYLYTITGIREDMLPASEEVKNV